MAYVEKFDGSTNRTVALVNPGDQIEGFFLGSKTIPSEYGDAKLHMFQTDKEGVVGIWGKTVLNNLLTSELLGMKCLVEFTGMIPPKKKGRKPAYGYKVKYDAEKKLPEASLYKADAPQAEETQEDDSFDPASFDVKAKSVLNNKR